MASDLIPITFNKIMQSQSYTVIILGTEEKRFAIYTDPSVGKNLQAFLMGGLRPRPSTHDLMSNILEGYNIKVVQMVIQDVEDTTYFARLFLELEKDDVKNVLEIDARPSDCITLALMNNVPVFCKKEVLEKAVAVED